MDMVERVARAICVVEEIDPDGPHPEDAAEGRTDGFPMWVFYTASARAAIEAMREAEPVAWLHTMTYETGETRTKLTDWDCVYQDEPEWTAFGRPGRDYSAEFTVTREPLYSVAALGGTDAA